MKLPVGSLLSYGESKSVPSLEKVSLEVFMSSIFLSCSQFDCSGKANRSLSIVDNKSPLPPPGASEDEDMTLLQDEPYVDGPVKVDYGTNLKLGKGIYINCKF